MSPVNMMEGFEERKMSRRLIISFILFEVLTSVICQPNGHFFNARSHFRDISASFNNGALSPMFHTPDRMLSTIGNSDFFNNNRQGLIIRDTARGNTNNYPDVSGSSTFYPIQNNQRPHSSLTSQRLSPGGLEFIPRGLGTPSSPIGVHNRNAAVRGPPYTVFGEISRNQNSRPENIHLYTAENLQIPNQSLRRSSRQTSGMLPGINNRVNSFSHLQPPHLSANQFVHSFSGTMPQQYPSVNGVPNFGGESNEAVQYGTAVRRTPVPGMFSNRARMMEHQGSFSGEPVPSLTLPFEPLSRHYQGLRQTQAERQRSNNVGENDHNTRNVNYPGSEGISRPFRGGLEFGRTGLDLRTNSVNIPYREPQQRDMPRRQQLSGNSGNSRLNARSLHQLFGISPEGIRNAAKDYVETSNNRPPIPMSSSSSRIPVNTGFSRYPVDSNGVGVNNGQLARGPSNAVGNTARSGSFNAHSAQNIGGQVDARRRLIADIGRIIDMSQGLNILNDGDDFESEDGFIGGNSNTIILDDR